MKEYLPIGSVVLLKGAKKKLVVMGIMQFSNEEKDRVFDYIGVPYPEGNFGKGNVLFNNEDINDVIFRGYENPERDAFMKIVSELSSMKNGDK